VQGEQPGGARHAPQLSVDLPCPILSALAFVATQTQEQQLVSQQGQPLTSTPIYFEPDGTSATLGECAKHEP